MYHGKSMVDKRRVWGVVETCVTKTKSHSYPRSMAVGVFEGKAISICELTFPGDRHHLCHVQVDTAAVIAIVLNTVA